LTRARPYRGGSMAAFERKVGRQIGTCEPRTTVEHAYVVDRRVGAYDVHVVLLTTPQRYGAGLVGRSLQQYDRASHGVVHQAHNLPTAVGQVHADEPVGLAGTTILGHELEAGRVESSAELAGDLRPNEVEHQRRDAAAEHQRHHEHGTERRLATRGWSTGSGHLRG